MKSNTAIKTFRHAISLDEHRAKFKANYYQWATDKELAREQEASLLQAGTGRPRGRPRHKQHAKHGSKVTDADVVEHTAERGNGSRSKEKHGHTVGEEEKERKLEKMYTDPSKPTDVLEVFFAGCHCGKLTNIFAILWPRSNLPFYPGIRHRRGLCLKRHPT